MRRRNFLGALGGAIGLPIPGIAQQPAGIPRIGVLMGATAAVEAAKPGVFREALERLGWADGKTIAIEPLYADGHTDRLPMLAQELVVRAPAVIACVGVNETVALQAATHTIPIVFFQVHNPVAMGIVASLARPGGNATGFSQMSDELDAKRVGLLHEIAPTLSRAVFLVNPSFTPGLTERVADAAAIAKTLGIALQRIEASKPEEVSAALAVIEAAATEAILVQNDPMLSGTERVRITDFAVAHRLVTVFEGSTPVVGAVAQGGLFAYGPDYNDSYRLAAGYVDRILRGAKPADLPIQQPTRFRLAINLKTAKAIGLAVPQSLLARADEVIE